MSLLNVRHAKELVCKNLEDVKDIFSGHPEGEKLSKRVVEAMAFCYELGFKTAYFPRNIADTENSNAILNGAVSFDNHADVIQFVDGGVDHVETRFKVEFILASLSDDPNQPSYLDCLKMDSEGNEIDLFEFHLIEIFS